MKTVTHFFIAISFLLFVNFSFAGNGTISTVNQLETAVHKLKIDLWITSKEGCKFHVVGDFSTWSLTFTGTVTGTGGGSGCPTGTWTFGLVISDEDDGETQIHGDNPFVDILRSEPETLNALVRAIRAMA